MKKLLAKDKKIRLNIKKTEKQLFILKSIYKNYNFALLIRWNSFLETINVNRKNSKVLLINKCILTENKKRVHKLTKFARGSFLKLIRFGRITGVRKSSW